MHVFIEPLNYIYIYIYPIKALLYFYKTLYNLALMYLITFCIMDVLFMLFIREEDCGGRLHHLDRRVERGGVSQTRLWWHCRLLHHQDHLQVPQLAQTDHHCENKPSGETGIYTGSKAAGVHYELDKSMFSANDKVQLII